jgi:hypothetical protein
MTYWVSILGRVMIVDADNEIELAYKLRKHYTNGEAIAFPVPGPADDVSPQMTEWLKTAPREVPLDPEKDIPAELWLDVNTNTAARQAAKAQMN